ncbi:MAG: FtsQ-type POTRA domain-containing protein [Patescibacteria group bacterium]
MRRAKKISNKKKKSIWRKKLFALAIVFGVIILAGFYFLVFSPYFQIKETRIEGAQKISEDILRDFANGALVSKIFFWPTKSIFTADVQAIEKKCLAQFPAINEINIKKKLPAGLLIKVVERMPVGQLCSSDKCFIIDSQAIIFEQISSLSTIAGPIIKLGGDRALVLGEAVLNKEQMAGALGLYKSATEKYGIELKEIAVSDKKLTAITNSGWEIYFNTDNDIAKQISNFEAVVDKLLSPEKRKGLEYIDLRFGDKVYYK